MTIHMIESAEKAALRILGASLKKGYVLEALHCYRNANGLPAFYRARLTHESLPKIIRPLCHDGSKYTLNEPPVTAGKKPVYRLPELVAADRATPVFVVEGELCADALADVGVVVTTSGGAGSAAGADWTPFSGRRCVVWPDNDDPGEKYAADVTARLRAVGCTVEVIDVSVLDLPEKGDSVDWLRLHPGATLQDVMGLAREPAAGVSAVELISAADLTPTAFRWLWEGWIARGKFNVLAGAPGTGKTTLAMDIAARVSAGASMPSGECAEPGDVVIWSGEDDPADTLVPRLLAAGADLSRIVFVGNVGNGDKRYPFDPAQDVPMLADELTRRKNVALLIIDPVSSAIAGNSHKNTEVRRGLAPLVELAHERDIAVLGITHYSKGTHNLDPLERVTGSLAFGALARIVLGTARVTTRSHNEPGSLVLSRCKSNIGPDGGGFSYAVTHVDLAGHPGVAATKVTWGGWMDGTARELLSDRDADPDEDGPVQFLRELLQNGTLRAVKIYDEAKHAGFSKDQMKRAKRYLAVRVTKTGMSEGWVWGLPDSEGSANVAAANSPLPSLPSPSSTVPAHPSKGA